MDKTRQRRGSWILAWLALAAAAPCAADLPGTIERVKPAVVGVGTVLETRSPQAQLRGTGFAVGDGRHVLTNAHVVAKELRLERNEFLAVYVGRGPGADVRRAEKVAADYEHDLVLLRISGPPLTTLKLGESDRVREGERYAFTGFPIGAVLGLYPATHHATVAAITPIVAPKDNARQLDPVNIQRLRSPYEVFQLDATAYPGSSGSPLYHPETGEVVAVVNMVFVKGTKESALTAPSGIAYAIPARYARGLLRSAGLGN